MLATKFKKRSVHILFIVLAAVVLCSMAFYNGFPMTFNSDTAIYIESGIRGQVHEDRPIIYGLFIALFSWQYSLWLIVIVQALIVALAIYYAFRYFCSHTSFLYYYIAFVALVSLAMGAAFEVGWLMPDVFAGVTILSTALIILGNKVKVRDLVILSLLIVLSIAVHNSHFFICQGLLCILLCGYLFKRIKVIYTQINFRLAKVLLVMGLAVCSNLLSAAIHNHFGAGFKSSFGTPVFLMANLIEMGVVDPYLAENCGKKNFRLCAYKDSIPNNFLWDKKSPLEKTGGWIINEKEYWTIEKDILTDYRYLPKVIYKSVIYTGKQFFNYDLEHVRVPTEFVKNAVEDYFPAEYSAFLNARQNKGTISLKGIDYLQHMGVGICLLIYCMMFLFSKCNRNEIFLILFLFAGILINAWVCSTFSGVYTRYQTRVLWLIPLPLFITFFNRFTVAAVPEGTWVNRVQLYLKEAIV